MKPSRKRQFLLAAVLLAAGIFVATQWELWRTGRDDLAPLALLQGGPKVESAHRIWIDTDAACGATPRTDPDDCLAILWLASRKADIVGISTSFGNASGEVVQARVAALATQMKRSGLPVAPIHHGHARPPSADAAQPPGPHALRTALESGPLTILALGPLTNIAAALEGRPDLHRNVTRIVAVMGHQPGHLFHPTEGKGRNALFGHGPIFPDLNLTADPASVPPILAMRLPITLIPYDAARTTLITAADLDAFALNSPAHRWVARSARGWLSFWNDVVGLSGFTPFDWVAAAYLVDPGLFDCAPVIARMTREWTFWLAPRASLVVEPTPEPTPNARPPSPLLYCPWANASLHAVLTERRPRRSDLSNGVVSEPHRAGRRRNVRNATQTYGFGHRYAPSRQRERALRRRGARPGRAPRAVGPDALHVAPRPADHRAKPPAPSRK